MKKENLDKLVQETIDSFDGSTKASPAPFLLTRIRAKMGNRQSTPSVWEKAGIWLTRPSVAFAVLAIILLMNVYIITSAVNGNNTTGITTQNPPGDEYSMNVASSLYDFENVQP